MFIELSEYLRCPESHTDTFCVVAPQDMKGRMIVRGLVGCPICRREYPIEDGVVKFGAVEPGGRGSGSAGPDPEAVWALLGLTGPGGFVVLVGSAAHLVPALAAHLDGVHFVSMNPAAGWTGASLASALTHPQRIPLCSAMARGVVLGAESAVEPWTGEGARVLLPGRRLVAAAERVSAPGLGELAAGGGLWVGRKEGGTS